jgi:ATP-dependent Clp protease, protease subunit
LSKITSKQEKNKKFWNFVNTEEDSIAELHLYGEISTYESWWDDNVVTHNTFKEDLKALGDKDEIIVRINSGGGDVFAANAIYTMLKDNKAKITVKIDGICASAATIIAMAADKILIPSNAYMMIHNPKTFTWDYVEAKDMRKMAEKLDVIKEGIMNAYVSKTGKDKETLATLMDEETWYTGEDAVDEGFADELLFSEEVLEDEPVLNGSMLVVNSVSIDLSNYKHAPFKNQQPKKVKVVENKITNNGGKKEMEIKNVEDLKKAYPDLVQQVENTAIETGVTNERERLKAIDEISNNLDEELVNKAKYTEPMNVEKLALEAIKNDAAKGKNFIATRQKEIQNSNTSGVSGEAVGDEKEEEEAAILNIAAGSRRMRGGNNNV